MTKAAQIMELFLLGKSTREIATQVYSLDENAPSQLIEAKMASSPGSEKELANPMPTSVGARPRTVGRSITPSTARCSEEERNRLEMEFGRSPIPAVLVCTRQALTCVLLHF
jgi:hypothetical protein